MRWLTTNRARNFGVSGGAGGPYITSAERFVASTLARYLPLVRHPPDGNGTICSDP